MKKLLILILLALITNVVKAQLSEFKMYPNPFIDDVTIWVKSEKFYKADYTLWVRDITGRTLINESGELIFGQNEFVLNTDSLKVSGIYLFQLISEGDTIVVKAIKQVVVGVNDLPLEMEISSYPNPVSNNLIIDGLGNQSSMKIDVFNVLGQLVYSVESVKMNSQTINLESLKPAIYFLIITDDSGNMVYRKEFHKI